jgi:hypothetical protein
MVVRPANLSDRAEKLRGFYLITLKSSEQDGLTGVKGSFFEKSL